jgi:hypothetical protein
MFPPLPSRRRVPGTRVPHVDASDNDRHLVSMKSGFVDMARATDQRSRPKLPIRVTQEARGRRLRTVTMPQEQKSAFDLIDELSPVALGTCEACFHCSITAKPRDLHVWCKHHNMETDFASTCAQYRPAHFNIEDVPGRRAPAEVA